jgi:RNA polymerase subunit RPABC4/transcription elongation factor Spt4
MLPDVFARPTIIWFLIFATCVFGSIYIAIRRGQPLILGVLLGTCLGPLGVIIVAFLPATELGQHLDKIRAQAKVDRQTIACPNCGRMNSIRSKVCPRCDALLDGLNENAEPVGTDESACPKCGRVNSIHTAICPRCETRLVQN